MNADPYLYHNPARNTCVLFISIFFCSEMEAMSSALQKAETKASQASKSIEALEYQLSEVSS